jgi:hypothetical protein
MKSLPVLAAGLSVMIGLAALAPVAEARGGHFGGGGRFAGGIDRGIGWRGGAYRGRRIYRWGGPAVAGAVIAGVGPYYHTGCDGLYARAAATGSSYWWAMHHACYYGN